MSAVDGFYAKFGVGWWCSRRWENSKKCFRFFAPKSCKGPPHGVLDLPLKFLRKNRGFKKFSGRKKLKTPDFSKCVQNVSKHVLNADVRLSEAILASEKSANCLSGTSVRLGDRSLGGTREGYGASKNHKLLKFLYFSQSVQK